MKTIRWQNFILTRPKNDLFTEDEGSRIKGRRITLSDINSNSLKWSPFNGTWINGKTHRLNGRPKIYHIGSDTNQTISDVNRICFTAFVWYYLDHELVYRDPTGGLSIISAVNFSTRVLMSNSTFVSFSVRCATFSTEGKKWKSSWSKVLIRAILISSTHRDNWTLRNI